MALRVGVVVGEASGDLLGAGLIQALNQRLPDVEFEGIAGPLMVEQGCKALYPSEKLAVMGLISLKKYLELRGIRSELAQRFIDHPPDIFIGIDAPDFNLGLELKLKKSGIPTIHYVSPSVWAWRQYRLRKISKAVDMMLTLFPFEADYYHKHNVPVRFVGHPLAEMIPMKPDQKAARNELDLPMDGEIIALMPGSRAGEIERLADTFIQAAQLCKKQRMDLHFAVALVTPETRKLFDEIKQTVAPDLPVTVIDGKSRRLMEAADIVMAASGTVTLEALLLKRPIVVAYKLAPLTYWLAKRLLRIPYYSLPNLLAGHPIIEEYIQDEATPENLCQGVLRFFENPEIGVDLENKFIEIHHTLKQEANERAADAVVELLQPT